MVEDVDRETQVLTLEVLTPLSPSVPYVSTPDKGQVPESDVLL